jgi:hypothetical protein
VNHLSVHRLEDRSELLDRLVHADPGGKWTEPSLGGPTRQAAGSGNPAPSINEPPVKLGISLIDVAPMLLPASIAVDSAPRLCENTAL